MLERVVYEMLSEGLTEIQGNYDLITNHFRYSLGLSEAETDKIKTYLQATPPKIIHHYARDGDKIPLWALILMGETQSQDTLGYEMGEVGSFVLGGPDDPEYDPDNPDSGADTQGSVFTTTIGVQTYSEHPDVTRYYYELAKFLIWRYNPLGTAGIVSYHFAGQDLMPDPRYTPAHLFVRQLTCTFENVQCLSIDTPTRASNFGSSLYLDDDHDNAERGHIDPGVTVNAT